MANPHHLVKRLLETPDIARVVPRLPPDVLHRVIDRCGLEDCVDLVALATPNQLERVLDVDLWRAPAPGADEALDGDRFGVWLEVLLQAGASVAADKLAAMDLDLIVDGFAAHARVFDGMAVSSYVTLDGEQVAGRTFGGAVFEIGGFVIEARRSSAWDAILELLAHLHGERPVFFSRLMRGCVALSNGAREADGFHDLLGDRAQHRSDLAMTREARRDAQGYVPPAQARAFLQAARRMALDAAQPPVDPVARACIRAIVMEPLPADESPADDGVPVAAVVEILSDAGLLAPPRALLGAGDAEADEGRLTFIEGFVASHLTTPEELAFLTNAVLAGCAVQGRSLTMQEASDGVAATCNLGLENWPAGWPDRDLVTAFQVGWFILHRDVCAHAATALLDVLTQVQCSDQDVQRSLRTLRRELIRHVRDDEPAGAREALDTILMLDASAWAVLRTAIADFPAMHAASERTRLRVDADAFTFIASNAEVAALRSYLVSLESALTA